MKFLEKNIGDADRIVRIALAIACVAAGYFALAAPLSYVAYFLALVLLFTAGTRSCGAYTLLGINTMGKKAEAEKK